MKQIFSRIILLSFSLPILVSCSQGPSISVSELLRDSGKYVNKSVEVRGIVSEKGESPDALLAKYRVVLKEGESSIPIFMDSSFESLPEVGKPFSVQGIFNQNGSELYLMAGSGFNILYVVLGLLGVIAIVLIWALAKKPNTRPAATPASIQATVSGLKVPCINPECRQMISPVDVFCEHCGQDQSKPIKSNISDVAPIKPSVSAVQAASSDRTMMEPGANSTIVEVAAAKLASIEGPALDRHWSVPGGETSIGRESGNRIQLDGANVSKRHARIRVEGNSVQIEDLNSTNGTYVNGERITSRELHTGDKVKIGSHVIIFTKLDQ